MNRGAIAIQPSTNDQTSEDAVKNEPPQSLYDWMVCFGGQAMQVNFTWSRIMLLSLVLLNPKPALTFGRSKTIANPSRDLAPQVDRVAAYLEGTLSTAKRAAQNPKVANVTMTTCRVTVTTPAVSSAIYLYQEQAIANRLNQPYRQRILEISPSPTSQTVRSRSFKLAQPQQWVNFCQRADRQLLLQDFPEVICSVFLTPMKSGFSGATEATGCPANVRGAVVIRNRIWLHVMGMETWDRGFDAQGKQVWGAGEEPYQFLRLSD